MVGLKILRLVLVPLICSVAVEYSVVLVCLKVEVVVVSTKVACDRNRKSGKRCRCFFEYHDMRH